MTEISFAVSVALWGVLPGLLLQHALGPGERMLERLAAAPGLSIALVAVSAYVADLLHMPVSALPVAAVAVASCASVATNASASPRLVVWKASTTGK